MQLLCRQYASYAVSLIKGDNNCNPSLCKYTMHLRCRIIKSVHPCTLLMASFGAAETSLLVNACGIRAAFVINAQRIISVKDGGGVNQ